MKTRNGNLNAAKCLGILLLCVTVNFGGKLLAEALQLPVWMDMIGTCAAVYYLGLPYGIITALLNNALFFFIDSGTLVYALVGVVCAVVFELCKRKGYTEKADSLLFASFLIAFSSAAVSIPLNIIFYDGYSGNMWGDTLFDMLVWHGLNKNIAAVFGETVVDVLDKQICLLICGLLFYGVKKRKGNPKSKDPKSKEDPKSKSPALTVLAVLVSGAVLSLSEVNASAADGASGISYNARIYNNQSGMMSSEANVISETDDGFLWIGSYAGLTRYNGTSFEFIRENGIANVTAMLCDDSGRLWIGTNDNGIARYENGVFTFFGTENGLSSNSIRCFREGSDGEMYVGTTDKLCVIRKNDEIEVAAPDVFFTMTMAFCDDRLICTGNDGKIHLLDRSGDCISVDSNLFFTCVCVTSDGVIAATDGGDLYVLNMDGSIKKKLSVPLHNIRCAVENAEGTLWMCADNGLGYVSGGKYQAKEVKDFAASLVDIHEDYQGNIWVASTRCGVLCLSPTSFTDLFDIYGAEPGVCNAVTRYNGGYCVGTDSGLVMLGTGGSDREEELVRMLDGSRVRSVMTDSRGDLWVCSYSDNGLVRMTKGGEISTYTTQSSSLVTSDRARCITEMSDKTIAVGTADGMYFIRDGVVTGNITRSDGLRNSQILTLTEGDDGILCVGSDGAGIFLVKDGRIIGNYSTENGLSSDVILRITRCERGLLIVTSNSLNLLSDGNITVLTKFPYYNNYDVLTDGDTAYVLSSAGIFIADLNDVCENGDYASQLINVNYGLESAITANSWGFVGDDGALYICCAAGIFRYTPSSGSGAVQDYKYGLSRIVCDGNRINAADGTVVLPKDASSVTFEGVVCNYSLSTPMVRFFEENGADSGIVPYSEIIPLTLNHPSSGVHSIHFQLFDASGREMISERVFTVTKERHTWETPWYRTYLIFMTAEIIIFIMWVLFLIIDDRRKRAALSSFNAELESKVAEQTSVIRAQNELNVQLLSQTVLALANTVDAKDNYTSGHSKRVAEYAKLIAGRMGKSEAEQEEIYRAGLLHDVGKIRIPEGIINKPGKLTDDEFALIKLHPITGYHILKGVASEKIFADGARFHHERFDGRGYPNGLAGTQIPEVARIIGIADAYDAMASRRSYRDVMPQETIRAEIVKCSGTQFDPDIAAVMLKLIDEDKEYNMKETNPGQKKILAVDDEPMNIKLINFALKDIENYSVTGAESGEKAVEMLRSEEYDIALIDIKMPGMDGYEAVEKIREFSSIPVVFMTVDRDAIVMDNLKKYGVTDFITKPFMPSALKEILHAVLSE